MKWSWKIGRFAGIDVFVHTTFLLLIGWVGFSYWMQTRRVSSTLEGIAFLLALFASVVLHEYGRSRLPAADVVPGVAPPPVSIAICW